MLIKPEIHAVSQTGPLKYNSVIRLDDNAWKKSFRLPKEHLQGTKLKEVQFKLIHRIVATKKELHRYGIKAGYECLYFDENDSIDYTEIFKAGNNSTFATIIEEK